MENPIDKFFPLKDGNQLFYQYNFTDAALPTVIFLNGLSQSTLSWGAIAPAFTGEYNTLLVDLVFQGKSSADGAFRTYDQHAADITALVEFLGIEHPVLCGLSYGSAVAQHAMVLFPDVYEAGILMSTFGHNTAVFNATGESWKSALHAGGYPLLLDIMLPTVLGASYFEKPLIPIVTLKEMRVSNNLAPDNRFKLMMATEVRGDYRPKLKGIHIPVLVIHGEEDALIPVSTAGEVADQLPSSEFVVLEKVGHTLNLEAIPQVTMLAKNFLADLRDQ